MNRYEAYKYANRPFQRTTGTDRQLLRAGLSFIAAALALLVVMVFVNCGTTTLGKINAANSAAESLTKVVQPLMDANCQAKARACRAERVETLNLCKPWVQCRDARRAYYDAINGVHIAAAEATVLVALGEEKELEAMLARCLEALALGKKLAAKAGFK